MHGCETVSSTPRQEFTSTVPLKDGALATMKSNNYLINALVGALRGSLSPDTAARERTCSSAASRLRGGNCAA